MAHNRKIAVVGLGYVGLPVAVAFGKHARVIGFDVKPERIAELKGGHDSTREVEDGDLAKADILFTTDPKELKAADFHIVAVPTPVDEAKRPDLTPVIKASETVGAQLKAGDIVVYESTVYPGATEEDCVPVLERLSGLKAGLDFTVGFSPERINPGDHVHRFTTITKVVSGQDQRTLDIVAEVYASVVEAGVHRASSIKVAEAAKVIENTQRDLNIALVNELAVIFHQLGLDTVEVLEAAGTKWNFLPFRPGLVGGHCIGVDPYYLTYKAETIGYHPQVILAGRKINDGMGKYVAEQTIKRMILRGFSVSKEDVIVLGLTFKENCPDTRNSRVVDVIRELESFGARVFVHDPVADPREAEREYGIRLTPWEELPRAAAIVAAVAHRAFTQRPIEDIMTKMAPNGIYVDVKSQADAGALRARGIDVWRL